MKRKCSNTACGIVTEDWMIVNGVVVCWACNKKAREQSECVHIQGTVVTVDRITTVTCNKCHAAWPYGTHPADVQLFDVRGQRFSFDNPEAKARHFEAMKLGWKRRKKQEND